MEPAEVPALFKTDINKQRNKQTKTLPPFQEGTAQMLNSGCRSVNPNLRQVLPRQPVLDAQKAGRFKALHLPLASTEQGGGIRIGSQVPTLQKVQTQVVGEANKCRAVNSKKQRQLSEQIAEPRASSLTSSF